MIRLSKHLIPKGTDPIRLVDYALDIFPTISSRSSLKKTIKRGELLVDGEPGRSGSWLREGQMLELVDRESKPPKPLDLPLEVVFEDEHLAIINKPAGIAVSGNTYITIQNALIGQIQKSSREDALKWPRPVHRLDAPTSGLLLVAKTAQSLMKLGQMLEAREVHKTYRAVVSGKIAILGEVNTPIEGSDALTTYKRLALHRSLKTDYLSLVELSPHTGRTHQLRMHMAQLSYPIVGDKLYGTGPLLRGKGLFLAAVGLWLKHPFNDEPLELQINQPSKFDALLERESKRWAAYK